MTCTCCKTPLTGGTDTFGQVGQEMCQWCFLALAEESRDAHRDYMNNQRMIISDLALTSSWAAGEAARKREELEKQS